MTGEKAPQLPLAWCRSTEDGTQQRYAELHSAHSSDGERPCAFCAPQPDEIIEEGDGVYALENKFPYQLWDRYDVEHHALVIPKLHVEALSDLPRDVRFEWLDMVMKYEGKGYSNYTRDPSNPSKSQPHVHTHVIALGARVLYRQHYDVETYSNKIQFED